MKHHPSFILLLTLVLVLGCQIANVIGAGPTAVLPTESPVVARSTNVPPTVTRVPPTQAVVLQLSPTAVVPAQSPAPPIQPTVPPAQPTRASAPPPPGCSNPNATITSLVDNGTVSGMIEIKGTATDPNMEYWKIEYRPEANTGYDQLSKSDKGITDDVLARLSTKTIANGIYFIRLVIVKKDGNFPTPCEFRVRVQN